MKGGRDVVLVAREVQPLVAGAPEWPGGAETVYVETDEPLPATERAVAVIPLLSRQIGAGEMDRLPRLRVVANYAVGYDNVDVEAARERGIRITNTPDVLTEPTADLTWALILAAARRLREGLVLTTSGRWEGWQPDQLLGRGLGGRCLAVLGAGRIGSAVARRAPGFGMEVAYWSRTANEELERDVGAERVVELDRLLPRADVLSVHLPLSEETEGLLGARELRSLPRGAVLVNTARGGIVDHRALARCLREGPVAAAGLDVYPEEPRIPEALRELENAFLLPHLGSATREAREGMWRLARDNVRRVLAGEEPLTPVA